MKLIIRVFTFVIAFGLVTPTIAQANTKNSGLTSAYPGDKNVRVIELSKIRSVKIKDTISEIDAAFEMGDGYYDSQSSASYMVFSSQGKLLGFMVATLLSYTEDPLYFLVAAFVNTKGERVGEIKTLRTFNRHDDEKDNIEELKFLPKELRPNLN